MTKTQANESGFVLDAEALEAAAKASYEYEGDRREIDYLGWSDEPENVRRQWLQSVRLPVETYCAASAAPIVPAPAYMVKALDEEQIARAILPTVWQMFDEYGSRLNPSAEADRKGSLAQARRILSCLSSAPVEEADAKAGESSDYVTHHNDWRKACRIAKSFAFNEADQSYWQHQIDTLDRLAASTIPSEPEAKGTCVPDDVRRLVIAARNVAFDDAPSAEVLKALDDASEAFAARVPWENEP